MRTVAATGRRRMTGAAAGSLALHALLLLLPFSLLRHGTNAAPGSHGASPNAMSGSFFAAALHGSEVTVLTQQPEVIAAPSTEPPVIVPEEMTKEEVEEVLSEVTRDQAPSNPSGVATPGVEGSPGSGTDGTAGAGDGGTGGDPVAASGPPGEVAMPPRVYVHPRIPYEIVRKRKINDYVLIQVLVSTDGSVKDVRILRAIANCEECTRNTVDAARSMRYNPVLVDGRAAEVWTVPIPYWFRFQH